MYIQIRDILCNHTGLRVVTILGITFTMWIITTLGTDQQDLDVLVAENLVLSTQRKHILELNTPPTRFEIEQFQDGKASTAN
jgi:hypothetical protein